MAFDDDKQRADEVAFARTYLASTETPTFKTKAGWWRVAVKRPWPSDDYKNPWTELALDTRDQAQALKRLEGLRAEWQAVVDEADTPTGASLTMNYLFDLYVRDKGLKPAQQYRFRSALKVFGNQHPSALTAEALRGLQTRQSEKPQRQADGTLGMTVSYATYRSDIAVLLHLVNHAEHKRLLVRREVCPDLKLPKHSDPRTDAELDAGEEAYVWECAEREGGALGLFVMVALDTGLRRGAIYRLTLDKLHMDRLVFDTRNMSIGNKRVARSTAFSSRLVPVLQARLAQAPLDMRGRPSGPLMPRKVTQAQWDRWRTKIGMPWFKIHGMRHTFATLRLREGEALAVVAAQLGDSPAQVAQTYSHIVEEDQQKMMAKQRPVVAPKPPVGFETKKQEAA